MQPHWPRQVDEVSQALWQPQESHTSRANMVYIGDPAQSGNDLSFEGLHLSRLSAINAKSYPHSGVWDQ